MAYLRKVPGSKMWYAAFNDSKGKLRNLSTKIRDEGSRDERASAKSRALGIARDMERLARGYDPNRQQIERTVERILEEVGGSFRKTVSTREFLKEWLSSKNGISEGSMTRYRQSVREFLEFLDQDAGNRKASKADLPVTEITPTDCNRFINQLSNTKGLSMKSQHNNLKMLRMPFKWGVDLQVLPSNPAQGIKLGKVNSTKREDFTHEEVQKILNACKEFRFGEEWRTAVRFGYYIGARLGDATCMRWDSIDLKSGRILCIREKSTDKSTKESIPLHKEFIQYLKGLPSPENPGDYITPNLALNSGNRQNVSKTFTKIVKRAGIENIMRKAQSGEGGRKVSTKTFHSFRHSATSALAQAGVLPEVSSKVVGHKSLAIHAQYTHFNDQQIREAVAKVPPLKG